MNTRPLETLTNIYTVDDMNTETTELTETESLAIIGFTPDEIISLLWLRQWYQNGGSDRIEVVRRLEYLKSRILNKDISL
ncbi:MAG TPA: hypothetical protein DHW02_00420 [Ktedonobacter sp.]|nr:hypothetical protein [Ktedonobacter sp.]